MESDLKKYIYNFLIIQFRFDIKRFDGVTELETLKKIDESKTSSDSKSIKHANCC